jgi:hypothetical protein
MKLSNRYEQTSCRLTVEGLPDLSAGQDAQTIGILTGFSLALAGRTELEGKREHLQALLAVVIPYARQLLSGVPRGFGSEDAPVAISPQDDRHQLELRSSQPNTPPLTLLLDDAELADLVRCLDRLRLDPRLAAPFELPSLQPLRRRELRHRQPLARRLAAPLAGVAALLVSAVLVALLPIPRPQTPGQQPAKSSAVSTPQRGG